jgi:hypothetical protein
MKKLKSVKWKEKSGEGREAGVESEEGKEKRKEEG